MPRKAQGSLQKEEGNIIRGKGDDWLQGNFPVHNRVVADTNSQRLRQHAQVPGKLKPDKTRYGAG